MLSYVEAVGSVNGKQPVPHDRRIAGVYDGKVAQRGRTAGHDFPGPVDSMFGRLVRWELWNSNNRWLTRWSKSPHAVRKSRQHHPNSAMQISAFNHPSSPGLAESGHACRHAVLPIANFINLVCPRALAMAHRLKSTGGPMAQVISFLEVRQQSAAPGPHSHCQWAAGRASCLSILFTTAMAGRWASRALRSTNRV